MHRPDLDPTHDPLDAASEEVRRVFADAVEHLERGDLPASRDRLQTARRLALGNGELCDRLDCSLAAVEIELGNPVSRDELRSILLRAQTAIVLHLAAYQIGLIFEREGLAKKALFYGRVSLDHARRTGRPELEARARNLIGNALVADSYFEEARVEYKTALDLDSEPDSPWNAMLRENMGYCEVFLGNEENGLRLLYQSLRHLRRLGADRFQVTAEIDLGYALLAVDRPRLAERHLRAALAGAERFDDHRALRNTLFLLAECATRRDDVFGARRACSRLAELSGHPDLAEFVFHTDALELINLRA